VHVISFFKKTHFYPNDTQTTDAQIIFVNTIPNVLIIGRKNAIASAINPDRNPLIFFPHQSQCKKKKNERKRY
jgi:hypothetical protein